jgi:hypothetical protein
VRRIRRALTTAVAAIVVTLLVATTASANEGFNWEQQKPNNMISNDAVGSASFDEENGPVFRVWHGDGTGLRPMYYEINGSAPREIPGGGRTEFAPTAIFFNGRMVVFHVGFDQQIYWAARIDDSTWTPWVAIPGQRALGSVSVALYQQETRLMLAYRGTDSHMYMGQFDQIMSWTGLGEIAGNGATSSTPAITELGTHSSVEDYIVAVHRGIDNQVYLTFGRMSNGRMIWTGVWRQLPGVLISGAPSIATAGSVNGYGQIAVRNQDGHLATYDFSMDANGNIALGLWRTDSTNTYLAAAPTLYRWGWYILVAIVGWNHLVYEKRSR